MGEAAVVAGRDPAQVGAELAVAAGEVPRVAALKQSKQFLIGINTMEGPSSVVAKAGSALGSQTMFPFEDEPPKMPSVMA
jgi:hypothetical protein